MASSLIKCRTVDGVRMLHENRKLCHTDLKPENILLVRGDYDVKKRLSSSGSGRMKDWKVSDFPPFLLHFYSTFTPIYSSLTKF